MWEQHKNVHKNMRRRYRRMNKVPIHRPFASRCMSKKDELKLRSEMGKRIKDMTTLYMRSRMAGAHINESEAIAYFHGKDRWAVKSALIVSEARYQNYLRRKEIWEKM